MRFWYGIIVCDYWYPWTTFNQQMADTELLLSWLGYLLVFDADCGIEFTIEPEEIMLWKRWCVPMYITFHSSTGFSN